MVSDHYPDYLRDSAEKLLQKHVMVRTGEGQGSYQWRQGRVVRLASTTIALDGAAEVCCRGVPSNKRQIGGHSFL